MDTTLKLLVAVVVVVCSADNQDNVAMESEVRIYRTKYQGDEHSVDYPQDKVKYPKKYKQNWLLKESRQGRMLGDNSWRPIEDSRSQSEPARYHMSEYSNYGRENQRGSQRDEDYKSPPRHREFYDYRSQRPEVQSSSPKESINSLGHDSYQDEEKYLNGGHFENYEEQRNEQKVSGFSSFVEHMDEDAEEVKAALQEGTLGDIKKIIPKSGMSFELYHHSEGEVPHPKPTQRTFDEAYDKELVNRIPLGSKQPDQAILKALRVATSDDYEQHQQREPQSAPSNHRAPSTAWREGEGRRLPRPTTPASPTAPTTPSWRETQHSRISVRPSPTPLPAPSPTPWKELQGEETRVTVDPKPTSQPLGDWQSGWKPFPSSQESSNEEIKAVSYVGDFRHHGSTPKPQGDEPHFSTPQPLFSTVVPHYPRGWHEQSQTPSSSSFRDSKEGFGESSKGFNNFIDHSLTTASPDFGKNYISKNNVNLVGGQEKRPDGFNHLRAVGGSTFDLANIVESHIEKDAERGPMQFSLAVQAARSAQPTQDLLKGPKHIKKFVHSMFKNFLPNKNEPKGFPQGSESFRLPHHDSLPRPAALVSERPKFAMETPLMTEEEFRQKFGHLETITGHFPYQNRPTSVRTPYLVNEFGANHSNPESNSHFWSGNLKQGRHSGDLQGDLKNIIGRLEGLMSHEHGEGFGQESKKVPQFQATHQTDRPWIPNPQTNRNPPELEARIKHMIGKLQNMLNHHEIPRNPKELFAEAARLEHSGHGFSQIERPLANWAEGKVLIPKQNPFPGELFTRAQGSDLDPFGGQKYHHKFDFKPKNVVLNHAQTPAKFDVSLFPSHAQKRGDNSTELSQKDVQLRPTMEGGFRPMVADLVQSQNVLLTSTKRNQNDQFSVTASLQVNKKKRDENSAK